MKKKENLSLAQYLKKYGIMQKFFANRVKATPATINRILNAGYAPSLKLALCIEKETKGEVSIHSWDLCKVAHSVKPGDQYDQKNEDENH